MTSGKRDDASLGTIAVRAAEVGMKLGEMAAASGLVVGARLGVIGAAMTNPMSGDYKELGRMVPEKAFALAFSGIALFGAVGSFQRDMAAQFADMAGLMTGGVPHPTRLSRLAKDAGERGARALMWPMAVSEVTMAPLHRTVTANARRLGRAKRAA